MSQLSFFQRKKVDEPQTVLSQYNPTSANYFMNTGKTNPAAKTPPPTTTPKPDAQKQQQQQQTTSSPFSAYLARSNELATRQKQNQTTNAAAKAQLLQQQADARAKRLEAQKPQLQANYNAYKDNTNQLIADEETNTNMANEIAQQEYGSNLRRGARAHRESMGNVQNLFASLGTVDSNSMQNLMTNKAADFALDQNQTLRDQSNTIVKNNQNKSQYISQAKLAMQQEESKLLDKLAAIDQQMEDGSFEKDQAILKAYSDADTAIDAIDKGLLDTEMGFAKTQYESDGKAAAGNKLPAAQATQLGDYDNSITQLTNLQSTIQQFSNVMGPIRGRLGSSNPYDTNAQNFQGLIKGVAQMVGKAMEGGVLRAEDVPKYEAILPNIKDTQEVAQGKINNVIRMLTDQKQSSQQSLAASGYNTPNIQNTQMQSQMVTAPDGQQIILVD